MGDAVAGGGGGALGATTPPIDVSISNQGMFIYLVSEKYKFILI